MPEPLETIIQRYKPVNLERAVVSAINVFAHDVVNVLKDYPDITDANRPGRFDEEGHALGYYERGKGQWSPRVNIQSGSFGHYGKSYGRVKVKKSQQIAASLLGAQAIAGYKLRAVSERLREKWGVIRLPNGAAITNSATYAPPVQSSIKQSRVMQAIGWTTDRQAIQKSWDEGAFTAALTQALTQIGAK